MKPLVPLKPIDWQPYLKLASYDTIRDGKHISLTYFFQRAIFWLKEQFSGGLYKNDHKEFQNFTTNILRDIRILKTRLDRPDDKSVFEDVKKVLEVFARVQNSSFGRGIADVKMMVVESAVGSLQAAAQEKLTVDVDAKIQRWIRAEPRHRRFACALNLTEVPYLYKDIPKGAVILTDPFLYLEAAKAHSKPFYQTILKTIEVKIKAFFCWLMTGMRYTHAELSLGDGERWDLDKSPKGFGNGEMTIKKTAKKTCYGAIFIPKQKELLEAANRASVGQYSDFDSLWEAIEKEARDSQPKIRASATDIARVVFPYSREKDYSVEGDWEPGVKNYGCSATVTALFTKFGIDIGKEFGKVTANVSPADLARSKYFQEFYRV